MLSNATLGDSRRAIRHNVAYVITMFGILIFTTACFFKFAVDIVFFIATVDEQYAYYYIYGVIMYLVFCIVLVFQVSHGVVEHTILSFDKIQQIKDEEAMLNEKAIMETV